MSADEIRRLVRIYSAKEKNLRDQFDKFKDAEMMPNLENISIARKDAIMTIKALLAYAAMVERCEKMVLPCNLEDCPCVPSDDGYCDSCDIPKHNEPFNYILRGDAGEEAK